jgi:glucosamine kinase
MDPRFRGLIGIAGASVPKVKDAVAAMIGDLVPGEIAIVGDMIILMEAAFPGLPGVVVLSGTGSFAFGRNHLGEAARAGGWGSAISDEGSGYWIGRAAVSAVLRAQDAAASTTLLHRILDCWRLNSLEELLQKGKATFAKAADIAKLSLWEFADLVKQRNIEWVRYEPEDVEKEFREASAAKAK